MVSIKVSLGVELQTSFNSHCDYFKDKWDQGLGSNSFKHDHDIHMNCFKRPKGDFEKILSLEQSTMHMVQCKFYYPV